MGKEGSRLAEEQEHGLRAWALLTHLHPQKLTQKQCSNSCQSSTFSGGFSVPFSGRYSPFNPTRSGNTGDFLGLLEHHWEVSGCYSALLWPDMEQKRGLIQPKGK